MKKKMVAGYIYSVLSAVIYGCMPIMAKLIYAEGVNAMTLVCLRNLLALPSLAVLAFWQRKTLKIPLRSFLSMSIPSLFGCALTPVLLFSSYVYLASGTATVFHFVYPVLVLLISFVFLKKKIVAGTLVSIILCFGGILLFYDPQQSLHWGGAALALSSGLAFAIYVVLLPSFQKQDNEGFLFTFYIVLWSSIIMLVLCLATNQLMLPTTLTGWGLCLLFALSVTTCAVVLFQKGAYLIGGEKTSILSALEPITGVVIGILVFQESCRANIIIGSVLVVAASILIAVTDLRVKRIKE